MSIAGKAVTAVAHGAADAAPAAAKAAVGLLHRMKAAVGIGGTGAAVTGASGGVAAVSETVQAVGSAAKWGGTVAGVATGTLKVAAVAAIAYGIYRAGKALFGSDEPEQAPLQATQMMNAPVMQPMRSDGRSWASAVGGPSAARGNYADMVRTQEAAMQGQVMGVNG